MIRGKPDFFTWFPGKNTGKTTLFQPRLWLYFVLVIYNRFATIANTC